MSRTMTASKSKKRSFERKLQLLLARIEQEIKENEKRNERLRGKYLIIWPEHYREARLNGLSPEQARDSATISLASR